VSRPFIVGFVLHTLPYRIEQATEENPPTLTTDTCSSPPSAVCVTVKVQHTCTFSHGEQIGNTMNLGPDNRNNLALRVRTVYLLLKSSHNCSFSSSGRLRRLLRCRSQKPLITLQFAYVTRSPHCHLISSIILLGRACGRRS
jgi:hypothetical protein